MELPTLPQSYLYYAPSPIHGLGVFTNQDIQQGTYLGEYVGDEYYITDFIKKYGRDYQYCYKMMRSHKVICAKEKRNWITYLNDGVYQQPVSRQNVILKSRKAYSLRHIQKGEELLLDYGKFYPWNK